jgi:hypothetical protein
MKPVKRVKVSMVDQHPPSRAWLIHQNDLKLWKDLNGLNGTSSGSAAVDERLRRKFGGYSGDPTARQLRSSDGTPVQAAGDEGTEVEIPDYNP